MIATILLRKAFRRAAMYTGLCTVCCLAALPMFIAQAGDGSPTNLVPLKVYACSPYTLTVTLTNSENVPVNVIAVTYRIFRIMNGNPVLSTTLNGPGQTIPPNGSVDISSGNQWTPSESGLYKVEVEFQAANDINPANNSFTWSITACKGGECLQTSSNFPFAGQAGDPVNGYTLGWHAPPEPNIPIYLGNSPNPLFFACNYDAMYANDGLPRRSLGPNWSHNFDHSLHNYLNEFIEIVTATGMYMAFEASGPNWVLLTPRDVPYQLRQISGGFQLYDPLQQTVLTFDSDGLLTTVVDTRGNEQKLFYNSSDLLSQVADNFGRTLSFTYDGNSNLAEVRAPGASVSFGYTSGVLTSSTDANGNTTMYNHATPLDLNFPDMITIQRPEGNTPYTMTVAGHKVTSQENALGGITQFNGPAALGGVTQILNPGGSTYLEEHNALGQLVRYTGEDQIDVTLRYNSLGQRTGITDRNGNDASFTYGPHGLITAVTDFAGNTFTYTYSTRQFSGFTIPQLASITYPDATTEQYQYDANGNLISLTNRDGKTWSMTRNSFGQPLTVQAPGGGIWNQSYNSDGTPASTQNPLGTTFAYEYDNMYRLVRVSVGSQTRAAYTYDAAGNLLSATDAEGYSETYTYDANNNRISFTDKLGGTTAYMYDGMDRLIRVTDPAGHSFSAARDAGLNVTQMTNKEGASAQFAYNALGRLTSVNFPGGALYRHSEDHEGLHASFTDPMSNVFQYQSDANGNVTSMTAPSGRSFLFDYDAMNNLTRATLPGGQFAAFGYDNMGRLTSINLPEGVSYGVTYDPKGCCPWVGQDASTAQWSYQYDAGGNLIERSDPLGNTTQYTYDGLSRLIRADYPGGMGNAIFVYNGNGQVTSASYSDGATHTYQYDGVDNLVAATGLSMTRDALGRIISSNGIDYTRDKDGRITAVEYDQGNTVAYTRNASGTVTQIQDWLGGSTAFTYDPNNRLKTITLPNNVMTEYFYDVDSRITRIEFSTGHEIDVEYNPDGTVKSSARNVPLQATAPNINFTRTFDAASQIGTFNYDKLGRLLDDGSTTFEWSLRGDLTSMTNGTNQIEVDNDAAGHPIVFSMGSETTNITWGYGLFNPRPLIILENTVPALRNIYTEEGRLLYSINQNNERTFYHFDEFGNTIFTTDQSGAIDAQIAYDPYCNIVDGVREGDLYFRAHGQQGAITLPGLEEFYPFTYHEWRWLDILNARTLARDENAALAAPFINRYASSRGNPVTFQNENEDENGSCDDCIVYAANGACEDGDVPDGRIVRARNGFDRWGDYTLSGLGGGGGGWGMVPAPNPIDWGDGPVEDVSANVLWGDYFYVDPGSDRPCDDGGVQTIGTKQPLNTSGNRFRPGDNIPPKPPDRVILNYNYFPTNTANGGKPLSPGIRAVGVVPPRLAVIGEPVVGSIGGGSTGSMWFFDPDNMEILRKVLNETGVSAASRYWVFNSGLNNVRFRIPTIDTDPGTTKRYLNPLGNPGPPILDTNAFATCP